MPISRLPWSKRASRHYEFRYERAHDGAFRTISIASGHGRFTRANREAAQEICENRLREQFPDMADYVYVSWRELK